MSIVTGADAEFNGIEQNTFPLYQHNSSVNEGSFTQISKLLFAVPFSKHELHTHF